MHAPLSHPFFLTSSPPPSLSLTSSPYLLSLHIHPHTSLHQLSPSLSSSGCGSGCIHGNHHMPPPLQMAQPWYGNQTQGLHSLSTQGTVERSTVSPSTRRRYWPALCLGTALVMCGGTSPLCLGCHGNRASPRNW